MGQELITPSCKNVIYYTFIQFSIIHIVYDRIKFVYVVYIRQNNICIAKYILKKIR